MVPEPAAKADWTSPCKIDPFTISIEKNLELLFAIDEELRKAKGVTLAETNMNFRRYEQWFFSTEGSEIHQTIITSGAGYAAHSFEGTEIQKRSYPNSFGGQFQNRGYELIEELELLEHAPEIAEQAVALHSAGSMSRRHIRHRSRLVAAGAADSRVDRPSHRTRSRAWAWKPTSPARRFSRSTNCAR